MSIHQAKKPYAGPGSGQSSITSYFTPNGTSRPGTAKDTSTIPPPAELPPQIQSNLLSVGMRIRKSVPEGYKTGDYSAFQLFSDPTPATPPAPDSGVARQGLGQRSVSTPALGRVAGRARARELTPFCGILKVGGMAQQGLGDIEVDDSDEMPFFSSQESTQSNSSNASFGDGGAAANKRRFAEEEDDEVEEVQSVMGQRVMAQPRRKKGLGVAGSGLGMKSAVLGGQENEGMMDFGEAEFLDYGVLGEVEMADA